ncbi:MAG: UPF0280 family protein [Marinosulfonomonas sp.]|nr:UPF0280 family protein [Marinosulfonomonas sp.]
MPQAAILPDGRLHLHQGPIDLIIQAWGADRACAFVQARARFQTILTELVEELDTLRQPACDVLPTGRIARNMARAAARHNDVFVTPMAAVAGAVADEICRAMCKGLALDKAYVNNGGDIAVWLTAGQHLTAAIHDGADAGRVAFTADQPAQGLATSGWQGRSHSFGIADAVTVIAKTAAQADVAATLIANAVNIADHPAITRQPANELLPDSDLGARMVTTAVGPLTDTDIRAALAAGHACAHAMVQNEQITAAALFLRGQTCYAGDRLAPTTGDKYARLQTA